MKCLMGISFTLLSCGTLMQLAVAQWTYRGYGEYETRQFPSEPVSPVQVGENHAVELRLEGQYRFNDQFSFGVQPFLRKDFNDSGRDEARLDELWVGYESSDWDLRVGNQVFFWGSLESVSLVNVLNPNDYREDILEPTAMGVPAVRLRRLTGNSDLSLYYLPYFISSDFPRPHSFYSISGGLPLDEPDGRFSPQVALRYFYAGSGFDVALSYFTGIERDPLFDLAPDGSRVEGSLYRSQRFGLEATKVIGELLLKAELVWRKPNTDRLQESLLFGLGAEYTLSPMWRQSDLTLFLEYLGQTSDGSQNEFQLLRNDAFLGARWTLNDQASQQLEVGLLLDLDNTNSYVWRVNYERNLTDRITLQARYTDSFGFFFDPNTDEDGDGALSLAVRFNF